MRSAWIVSAMIGLMLTLTLSGCGDGGWEDHAGDNTRYIALGAKVRGLDPMDIGDTTSSSVGSQIYECLFQYHYLKRPYELIPCLAADMPEVSEDGLTYTITLRDDVYFQDDACFPDGAGRKVTAQDFIYSWKRIADVQNISKNWWVFDGRIVGLNAFREQTEAAREAGEPSDYAANVEGLSAPDERTLVIELTRPWPQILYLLAHLPTAVVPREAVEHYGDEFQNHPVGTGPYMLERWERGSRLVMARNPEFRDERYPSEGEPGDRANGYLDDAGKKLPFIDRIEWQVIEESQPAWLLFLQGRIDASGIPKDNYSQAIDPSRNLKPQMEERGIDLLVYDDPATFWLGFNMEDPVVGTNAPLRRAMSLAFDRDQYIKLFSNNRARPADGIFPPMLEAYDPNLESPYTGYDVERAKELVKQAEQVHGGPLPTLHLFFPGTDTTSRQSGQFITRQYARIGLTVEPEYMDWPTFQDQVKTKSAQVFTLGWIADYPDAENFLQCFYGPNESPGPNNFNYDNARFNELFDQASTMRDSPERLAMYREMERILVNDIPCVPMVHRVAFVLHYDWLKNYKPHAFGYGLAKYQRLDVEQRVNNQP